MIRLALLACASALIAVATVAYAVHERHHWAEMSVEDYVALLEDDEGVTFA